MTDQIAPNGSAGAATPSLFELDSRFRALVHQRNAALDENVILFGELSAARARINELEIKVMVLTPMAQEVGLTVED